MADLIDRAAAVSKAHECLFAQEAAAFEEFLELIPTVDAVEVVRCKDCRFCKKHPTSDDVKMCTNQEWNDECYPLVEDDDYCSRGERRGHDG